VKRRDVLALIANAIALRPAMGVAQQSRIGIIDDGSIWDNFRAQLRSLGHIDGENLSFEYRVAEGNPERLIGAAKDLAGIPVDLIAVFGSPAARAAQAATDKVPVVAISIGDPVRIGLVKSLAHPGGNVTGNTILGPDLVPKRLQLLKEVLPLLTRISFLWNPDNESNRALLEDLQNVAPGMGVIVTPVEARTDADFDAATNLLAKTHSDAVLTTNDPVHQRNMRKIIDFLLAQRIPGMFQLNEQVAAGGLMSYGANLPDLFRRGAVYAHRILQGTKPADLPVEQPITFELAVNLKTAKALGVTIPQAVLLRADDLIE
jgi:putative ABC transport system substrate-binding protein